MEAPGGTPPAVSSSPQHAPSTTGPHPIPKSRAAPGGHTQVSPPVLTPALRRPWGTSGSPALPLPCPAAWPLYGLGAFPALGHSPQPCRLSSRPHHQHCSFVCFHFALIRVAFISLHPVAMRSFPKAQQVTPLCLGLIHRPVRAPKPCAAHAPPPHPLHSCLSRYSGSGFCAFTTRLLLEKAGALRAEIFCFLYKVGRVSLHSVVIKGESRLSGPRSGLTGTLCHTVVCDRG